MARSDRPIRPRPERRLHPGQSGGDTRPKVVCRDCGEECRRRATGFECGCGFGFVVHWDTCIARGLFLGRIEFPEMKEMVA